MLKIIHNITPYVVDYVKASEESPEIAKIKRSEIQIDDNHSEKMFSTFVNYLNGKEIEITRENSYSLEILACEFCCQSLHDKIFDFAIKSGDFQFVKNLSTHIFEFGYHAYEEKKAWWQMSYEYEQELKKLRELKTENSDQIKTLIKRCPRDNFATVVTVGFFGAPKTGKTSVWRLLDPSIIQTPLESTISDDVSIYSEFEGKSVCYRVEDTGGVDQYRPLHIQTLNYLDGAIYVYRNDSISTLEYIDVLMSCSKKPKRSILMMIRENDEENEENKEKGKKFAEKQSMEFYSGKADRNVVRIIEEFLISIAKTKFE